MNTNNFKKFVTNPVNFSLGVREIKRKSEKTQSKQRTELSLAIKKKKKIYIYIYIYCKDQFRLKSNTGMDPGPRSPNNEFVECGKKS